MVPISLRFRLGLSFPSRRVSGENLPLRCFATSWNQTLGYCSFHISDSHSNLIMMEIVDTILAGIKGAAECLRKNNPDPKSKINLYVSQMLSTSNNPSLSFMLTSSLASSLVCGAFPGIRGVLMNLCRSFPRLCDSKSRFCVSLFAHQVNKLELMGASMFIYLVA